MHEAADAVHNTRMKLARTVTEIASSSYYRCRPVSAAGYVYAKWRFRRSRASGVAEMLTSLGINPKQAMHGYVKWQPLLESAASRVRDTTGHQGAVSLEDGKLLFAITRALQPEVVIETGVAAGISSSFIGAALIENGKGALYSIELPTTLGTAHSCADGSTYDWPVNGPGWAVPPAIKQGLGSRAKMLLADVRQALPALLAEVGHVDLFFHDDLHLPDHVLWEFQLVWPRLRAGGALVADDVDMGWIRFARQNRLGSQSLLNMDRLAAARKR